MFLIRNKTIFGKDLCTMDVICRSKYADKVDSYHNSLIDLTGIKHLKKVAYVYIALIFLVWKSVQKSKHPDWH